MQPAPLRAPIVEGAHGDAEAPTIHEAMHPETGRKAFVQWTGGTQDFGFGPGWAPLGGAETDVLSPEAEAQKIKVAQAGAQRNVSPPQSGERYIYDDAGNVVSVEPIPGYQPKMTEGQSNAALYVDRMRESEKAIQKFTDAALNPVARQVEKLPLVGNYMQTPEYRQFEQARRDFINAVLRRESGAVISDQEFANAEKQYFPAPGDDPATIAAKAHNRRVAIDGISRAAGPSYKPAGEQSQGPKPGTVEGGYRFKGGDPGKQENWEKVP